MVEESQLRPKKRMALVLRQISRQEFEDNWAGLPQIQISTSPSSPTIPTQTSFRLKRNPYEKYIKALRKQRKSAYRKQSKAASDAEYLSKELSQVQKEYLDLLEQKGMNDFIGQRYFEEKILLQEKLTSQLAIEGDLKKEIEVCQSKIKDQEQKIAKFEQFKALADENLELHQIQRQVDHDTAASLRAIIERHEGDITAFEGRFGGAENIRDMLERLHWQEHTIDKKDKTIKGLEKSVVDSEKKGRDLQKTIKNMSRKEGEMNEKLKTKDKRLEEVESGVRSRERDVKLREEAVKEREQKLREQPRRPVATELSSKRSSKELKTMKVQWEKDLKEAQDKAGGLEKQLKSVTEKYKILKLDYDAAIIDVQDLKIKSTEHNPDHGVKEKLRKLEEDRDKFKGLFEANRSNERIIEDRIKKAVREANFQRTLEFDTWKTKAKQAIQEADQRLLAAEARAEGAQKQAKQFTVEAGIGRMLDTGDETILELSRAKLGLLEENRSKDEEISAKSAELESKEAEIACLGEALVAVSLLKVGK
jgi:chromosome segregation ATPase